MKVIVGFIILTLAIIACRKNNTPPLVPLSSNLIDGPWQLVSSTQNNINGTVSSYNGTSSDSVLFLYGYDINYNIKLTTIRSYINNTLNVCNYKLTDWSYGIPNPYDTILCSAPWRNGYSDTLFVKKFTDNLLIFQVRFTNTTNSGIELDTLKKVRFY